MNKKLALGIVILVVGGLAFGALSRSCVSEAYAQQQLTPAVALARLCISEAGWDCFESGDGAAIHEVILRGAAHQNIRYTSYARAYAQRLFGVRPHDNARLRWVGQITPHCTQPADWPDTYTRRQSDGTIAVIPHPPWSNYVDACRAVMQQAEALVETNTLVNVAEWSTCEYEIHDWGGNVDRIRAQRLGLIEVECGDTQNDFYCRPSRNVPCENTEPVDVD